MYVHYVLARRSCNWITISHVRLQIDHLNYPPIIAGDINIRRIIFTLTAGVPVCVHLAVHLRRPQCVHLSHIRHLRDTTCELVGQNIHTHSIMYCTPYLHLVYTTYLLPVSLCLFLSSVLPLTFFLLHITCSSSVLHLAYTISHLKPPFFSQFFHSSPPSPLSLSHTHTHTHSLYTTTTSLTHYTPPPPHSLTIHHHPPHSLSSSQEHWNVRSKGLLQDFANSHLGRVRVARARAYSGTGDSTDEEDKDYDMIRGALILTFHLRSFYRDSLLVDFVDYCLVQ